MPPRKWRIRVVLDTNVFVRSLKAAVPDNPNYRVVRLWLCERRLELAVCREVTEEYLRVFSDILGLGPSVIERWGRRFDDRSRIVSVRLGKRVANSTRPEPSRIAGVMPTSSGNFSAASHSQSLNTCV